MRRRAAPVLGAVFAALVGLGIVAPAARAASPGGIVYARNYNVWITSPDGSNVRQLTFDGTAASPWIDPSMSVHGTVFAIRNRSRRIGSVVNTSSTIYRMNQAGRIVGRITPLQYDSRDDSVTRGLGITAIAASPTGDQVAYQQSWLCPDAVHPGFQTYCSYVDVAYSDGSDDATVGNRASLRFMETPSWANANTLLLANRAFGISYYRYGANSRATPHAWFGYGNVDDEYDADLTRGRLALVGRFDTANGPVDGLQLLAVDAHLPAKPTPKCLLTGPAGRYQDPSWSPDGGWLTWAESDGDHTAPEAPAEGVWVAKIAFARNGCAVTTAGGRAPIVPDGETPEWGRTFMGAANRRGGTDGTLTYFAGSGVRNDVKIVPNGADYAVIDRRGNAIAPGGGCTRFVVGVLSCGPRGARQVVAWGYDGDDRIAALVGVPVTLRGGAGDDTLIGGTRGDRLSGGRGRDVISGGAGNDVIDARDGSVDRVNCGPGRDTVVADAGDIVRDCETVHR
jgi:hypothetical protein